MIKGVIVMKKKLLLILPIMVFAIFYFVGDADAGSKTLNLTTDSYTLSQGKTLHLKINGVKAKKVKWKSSNKKVATVSKNGTVKAVKSGNATISGKYKGITFKTKITVKENATTYNKILCEDDKLKVTLKEIKDGKIYITLENKHNKEIEVFGDIFEINGESYSDDIWEYVQPGFKCNCKLTLYDEDDKTVDYTFNQGHFKGSFTYYYTSDYDSNTISFDVNI